MRLRFFFHSLDGKGARDQALDRQAARMAPRKYGNRP
jgi:hypothetical protein